MDKGRNVPKILTVCLGGFWLLDGLLQLQPAMFAKAFVDAVLAPNLEGQPGFVAGIINFGIHIWSINFVAADLIGALTQILIGALLVLPLEDKMRRFGLWLSVAWALIIWVFGEGFGNLATGSATFYTGAPGSAALYLLIALFLLYGWERKLPFVAGVIFLLGALLNLAPMFWQPSMLSMIAMVPAVSGAFGSLGAQGTQIGNLIAVDILAFFGVFLLLAPSRKVAWATIVFLLVVWWLGQNFGGLLTVPFGTATDPNSAPVLALFLIPLFSRGIRFESSTG